VGSPGELARAGRPVVRRRGHTPTYMIPDLQSITTEMIAAATAHARRAAEKFAQDSGAEVGGIRRAQQGYFSIEDRDAFSPEVKKVRVVTSVDYFLSGD